VPDACLKGIWDDQNNEVSMMTDRPYWLPTGLLRLTSRLTTTLSILLVFSVATSLVFGQSTDQPRDRVLVEVPLRAGTNMAAAVSPDGSSLMLNVQGVMWTLPRSGGEAVAITPAEMDVYEPAWSPDGQQIAFYAYTDDIFSIWMMNADGTDRVQLTDGLNDARYPSFSSDGSTLYYAGDSDGGYGIWALDLATRQHQKLVDASEAGYVMPRTPRFSGVGNAVYPVASPDNSTLAFVIDGPESQLVVRDMNGGPIRTVYSAGLFGAPMWSEAGDALYVVAISGQEAELVRVNLADASVTALVRGGDIFPFRPSRSPDGVVFYTADGGVKTLNANGDQGNDVEFTAYVILDRTPYTRRSYALADTSPRPALGIIDPVLSPDGSHAAFTALGDLWHADLSSGQLRNLTDNQWVALSPSWSPDGRHLAYVSDESGWANIWLMDVSSGQRRQLTNEALRTNMPVWSPDGTRLAYLSDIEGNDFRTVFDTASIKVADVASGQVTQISDPIFGPSAPAWSPDGSMVAVYKRLPLNSRFREGYNGIFMVPASGTRESVWVIPHEDRSLGRRQFNRPAWSVNGEMVYRIDGQLWLATLDAQGNMGEQRMIVAAGENPSWSADGNYLIYLDGASIMMHDRASGENRVLDIKPMWSRYLPDETYTLRAGRVYNGVDEQYLRNIDIVMENGVIRAMHAAGSQPVRGTLIDASDKVVLPGLIEGHTHRSNAQGDVLGEIYLRNGITTVRETGEDPYYAVERRESEAAGRIYGPRMFTAGSLNEGNRVSYGVSETAGTLATAAETVRLSAELELDMYKSYVRQDYTTQREVIRMAHEAGIPVSSHELYPAVANGIDMLEHFGATSRRGFSLLISRLGISYDDVIELVARSGVIVTPTLALSSGNGTRDISTRLDTLKRLSDAGARFIAGTDSPFIPHAEVLHTEIEHYVQAGLTPARALRSATSDSAEAIGAGDQLGRVEVGYMGDLTIVSGDPLNNIRDTRNVEMVFKTGTIVWPRPQ
jgi:Tol biopolymer transport system component/imidazolonepropionase-like amidohydrolase